MLMEFAACKEEFESDAMSPDLITAFMKIGKLLDVLTIFDISKEEKEKFESMGMLISQVRRSKSIRSEEEIRLEPGLLRRQGARRKPFQHQPSLLH